jgi:hypothetical protein
MAVLEELQVPPATESARESVVPVHSVVPPVITPAVGPLFTRITLVLEIAPQPLVTVYEIVAVPELTPVTIPRALTVAMDGADDDQVPPVTVSL